MRLVCGTGQGNKVAAAVGSLRALLRWAALYTPQPHRRICQ
jgi:hypothetical protein